MIASRPNQLHIYDPVANADVAVDLVKAPLSLTLSPDGAFAAVGHDALISYIDVAKGEVIRRYEVPVVASNLTMSYAWIYVMPAYYGDSVSLNIANGNILPNNVFYGSGGKYNSSVRAVYGTRDGISPNDVLKYEATTGPITKQSDSPYHGDYSLCGPVWFSPDETRIYTGCSSVVRASANPDEDMRYLSSLDVPSGIRSLSESEALGKIALIRENGYREEGADDRLLLLESAYLTREGELRLPPFRAAGRSFAAHARWLTFNRDSTEVLVLSQADEDSGALNDYGIERISLTSSGACGSAFEVSSAEEPARGGPASVEITAPVDCIRQATASEPWVHLLSGDYGSGDGTLAYLVEANQAGARSATVSMPGASFTIHQAGADASGASRLTVLGMQIVDAEHNSATDQITYVTAQPRQLHIFDPATRSMRAVPLAREPLSVSVRPDGAYAAVGHDGWVSYVNLATATVERVIPVITDVGDVILASNGFMYLFPRREWSDIYSYELARDTSSATGAIYTGRTARLTPDGQYIYATSGSWFSKWDIRNGVAKMATSSSGGAGCGNIWIAEDGRRIFNACAKVYRSSEVGAEDLEYNGSLSETPSLQWADHSAGRQMLAVIPGESYGNDSPIPATARLQLYSDAFLTYQGAIGLPQFVDGDARYFALGQWVFWSRDGSLLYVIEDAAAPDGVELGSAIAIVSPEDTREITVTTIRNAASGAGGPIAPGEIVSIFGQGLGPESGVAFSLDPQTGKVNSELGETQVFFGSTAAPILYSSSTQVNAIVPYDSYSQNVWVAHDSLSAARVDVMTGQVAPGVFTLDGSGTGQAVAIHPDGTLADAGHPVHPGDYVTIYFTGGGITSPSGETGGVAGPQPRRFRLTPTVTVGGVAATVTYAGAAPGLVEGVGQLNIRLAAETPPGDAAEVVVSYAQGTNRSSSQPGATIAVR